MKNRKIVRCSHCHKIVVLQEDATVPLCCGIPMEILQVCHNVEKEDTHLPVIARKAGKIYTYVGAYDHPMVPEHFIECMILESEDNARVVYFKPGEKPEVSFLQQEAVICVYAYCNKDGFWLTEI